MRALIFLTAMLVAGALQAEVVRPAPDFGWGATGGATRTLKSLRGQPVVLLIADSGRNGRFRKQVENLEELYRFFSARQVVFAAALNTEGENLKSSIPFVLARSGQAVAQSYGVDGRFAIVIIGPDGNIDLQTDEVLPAARVQMVLANSFEAQKAVRQ